MSEELPPTILQTTPYIPAPEGGIAPAGRLPGPHAHIRLTEILDGEHREPQVYRATSAEKPAQDLVVYFRLKEPDAMPGQDASRPRYAIDLRPWQGEGWPPVAIVTAVPIPLPFPYQRIELVDFIGRGGMGQVWMAQSPDYPGQDLAVK